MRVHTRVLLTLAALLLTAGCLGLDDGETLQEAQNDTPLENELIDPLQALENGEPAANLHQISHWDNGAGQELDPAGDHLYVSHGDHVTILNVTDPNNPTTASTIQDIPNSLDVKVSDDRAYAFIADDTEASEAPQGGTGPLTGGIYAYDVTDPNNPQRVTYEPVGNSRGPHMVTYFDVPNHGEHIFGASGDSVTIHHFDRDEGTLEEVARYTPGQLEQNRDPHVIDAYYNARGWLHDMFVMAEPDGSTYMYVAAWDAGLRIVDITDPSEPEELGSWSDFADDEAGNLHTVTTEWIDDRRITVGTPEIGFAVVGGTLYATGDERNVVYVWDTTDPTDPELVTRWVNPVEETTGRTTIVTGELPGEEHSSPHNLQLEEGIAYIAHYNLGVWVIDLRTAEDREDPPVLAYHMTEEMNVWDVVLNEGVVYSSGASGVQAFQFPLSTMGSEGITSRA